MAGADDDHPVALRIGGWVPPVSQPTRTASDLIPEAAPPPTPNPVASVATSPLATIEPAAPAIDLVRSATERNPPTTGQVPPVRTRTWIPPDTTSPLGEQPAHRRGGLGPPLADRSRGFLLIVVAAAASIPLVLTMAARSDSDGQAAPQPTVQASAAGPQPVLVPSATSPAARITGTPSPSTIAATSGDSGARPTAGAGGSDTRPTPSPPPMIEVDISLEAEGPLAVRSGGTTTRELAAASGGTVVTDIGAGPANHVRFSRIDVPRSSTYTLTFHYVATERLRGRVTVNGATTTIQFSPTANEWGTVGARSVRLSLRAGRNVVEFGNKNAPAPDLDRLVVTG